MKLMELLRDVEIVSMSASPELEISGIAYDSRKVGEGFAFVAIRGLETDGHKYIAPARERGASCVICEEPPESGDYVAVRDSRRALALMSRNFYGDPASEMTVIGVTGTNGKTTTTYLMKHLLESQLDAKVGLIGTNGNMIGSELLPTERTTPESLELHELFRSMADAGCTHVVMEVSSHSLALSRVAGINFKIGIFTNLTQDHLDFHGTMENYAEAKARLFSQCESAVINIDDDWGKYMLDHAACPAVTFSEKDNSAFVVAKDIRLSASGVRFAAVTEDGMKIIRLGIPGLFSVYNALGVIASGLRLNLTLDQCADALGSASGVKGRVEVVPTDGDYTVLIDYAHTPDALSNVLRSMRSVTDGRIVVLFGCGGDRDRTKRPIMGKIAGENADFVIVTSDNPRTEKPEDIIADICAGLRGCVTPHKVIPDRPRAIEWAIENHKPGDVIILAGKGHEDYQIVGHEKHHMDEREIVAEIIQKRMTDK